MNETFPSTSRYFNIEIVELTTAGGRTLAHLRRRFLPPAARLSLQREHVVVDGDRLDNLSATYLGDPEQFWRICDANDAMLPDELVRTVGRRLRITLPEGLSGPVV